MNTKSIETYQLSKKKEANLFKKGIVIFDTSALLDFYYYSKQTQDEVFNDIFKKFKKRLWIPNQVEFEFLKNREKVLTKPKNTYSLLRKRNPSVKDSGHMEEINNTISKVEKAISKELKGQYQTLKEKTAKPDKHPFLDQIIFEDFDKKISLLESYIKKFRDSFNALDVTLKEEVDQKIKKIEHDKDNDPLLKRISSFFMVGNKYEFEKLMEIVKIGKTRYENQIPPGYEDQEEKIGLQIYGDLIAWIQIIEFAQTTENPIILVTNDIKND